MIEHNGMILPDHTLEAYLDYRNKKYIKGTVVSVSFATVLTALVVAGAVTDYVSDHSLSGYGDPYFRRIMLSCCGLGTIFGIIGLVCDCKIGKYSDYNEYIKQLMQDEKLAADINSKIIRLMPLAKKMMAELSNENQDIADMFENGQLKKDLSEQELLRLTDCVKKHLREHQNIAIHFLNLATADKMDVRAAERFMAECMPNTITFAQAQKLCGNCK